MCNDLRSLQSKYLMRVLVNSKFQLAAGSVTLKLISWLTVLSQNLKSLLSPPCIMCVQYIMGCSVHRRGVQYIGGYHEYIGGIS